MTTKPKIQEMLEAQEWKFASTMKTTPHWYILENKIGSKLFDMFARYINNNLIESQFYRSKFYYCFLGEYKYWVMTISDGSGIINRAKV